MTGTVRQRRVRWVKSSSRKPTTMGVSLERVTPNFSTMFSATICCEIVIVPESKSRENRQPAYNRNSPRLVMGTYWLRSLPNWSHLLFRPIQNMSSTCTTTTMDTTPSSTRRITHASRCTLLETKRPHPSYQMVVPCARRLFQTVEASPQFHDLTRERSAALWHTKVNVLIQL